MAKKEGFYDGRFISKVLDFNINMDSELTSKANFLFGASSVVFLFLLNRLLFSEIALNSEYFLLTAILLVGSSLSALLALMVILPKIRIFSKKERVKEDIFYYKNITSFYTRKQYIDYLKKVPLDSDLINKAYANQVYSLAMNIIPYKFRMLKFSGWLLTFSVFFSLAPYVYSLF